jgi:hypothetical protein
LTNYYENYKVGVPEGESGKWKVSRFTIDESSIGRFYFAFHGRPVPVGDYTRLTVDGEVMMSDTPAEIKDSLSFIYAARGNCLINGLGLGVVLKAVASKPEVTHIDVVEKEQDVINLVWPTYQGNPKITLYHDDALSIRWPGDKTWDYAWHDIWMFISADNMPEITRLKRKYSGKVSKQMTWCEQEVRSAARQERKEEQMYSYFRMARQA